MTAVSAATGETRAIPCLFPMEQEMFLSPVGADPTTGSIEGKQRKQRLWEKPWSQSRLEFAVWPQTRKSQLLNSLVSKVRSSACLSPSCYQLLHAKIQQNNTRPGLYGREQSPTKYLYIRKLTRGRNDLCSLGTCSAWIRWGRSSYWENPLMIS